MLRASNRVVVAIQSVRLDLLSVDASGNTDSDSSRRRQ